MPSDWTFYRLFGTLSHAAWSRDGIGLHPPVAGRAAAGARLGRWQSRGRPGEVVQIDSTPLDVLVLLDDGFPGGWR